MKLLPARQKYFRDSAVKMVTGANGESHAAMNEGASKLGDDSAIPHARSRLHSAADFADFEIFAAIRFLFGQAFGARRGRAAIH